MSRLLALTLLLASAPVAAQTVQVAESDWSYLPRMEHVSNNHLDSLMLAGVHDVIRRGDCEIPGQRKHAIDLTVPFATQLTADGKVNRLVLKPLGCAEVEGIVAGALLEMLKGGDYRPVSRNAEGWYQGEFSFASTS